jgi:dolichol kinase
MPRAILAILLLLAMSVLDARKSPAQAMMPVPFCTSVFIADPFFGAYRQLPRGQTCARWEREVSASGTYLASQKHRTDRTALWISLVLPVALFFTTAYLLGRGVLHRGWNANDTRKGLGVIMFALPPLIPSLSAYAGPDVALLGYLFFLLVLLIFIAPLRRRSEIIATAFAALDRPEDRPFTLLWLVSAYIASAVVFVFAALGPIPIEPVLLIAVVLAITVGDIAAGVVGRHFGRHTYATIGLGTSRGYVRSYEGSAAMLAVATAVIAFVTMGLQTTPWVLSLLILPATLTIAEALSPHTWDEPIMYAAGVAGCVALQMIVG